MNSLDDEPRAIVERRGRFTYRVLIEHGITMYAPDGYGWLVMGRRRAARLARRELARYIRERAAAPERLVISAVEVTP